MTQAELDLARLAMMIARMQLKTMAATAHALNGVINPDTIEGLEKDMTTLARKIETGEYRGSDAGQG